MSVVYPRYVHNAIGGRTRALILRSIFDAPEVQTVAEWTAVLRFATMWQFKAVKRLAIKQLDECVSPLQRLVLARAYNLSRWLEQAFVALISMDELPDEAQMDGLDLNLKDFMRITRAREAIAKGRLSIDEQSVLLYVQERILAVASTIPLEARSTSNETSAMPSPDTHTHAQAASTAGQTMALAGTLHVSPSEKAGSSLSSSHWQPALQSLPSDSPTAPLTPAALATTFAYVPYSIEEADRVRSKLLYYGSFDLAFNTIASASVPAFCETLHAQVFKEYGARFFQSLAARAARFPSFHPAGLYIASYAIRAFHPKCGFETDVKATLAVLNGLDGRGAQLSNDNISTTLDRIPTTYKSGSRNIILPVYSYLGLKEFLVYHPAICRQRIQNLKVFLTALAQAGLTDCDAST